MHKVLCLPTILSSISTIIRYNNNEKKGDRDKKRYNGDAWGKGGKEVNYMIKTGREYYLAINVGR